MEEKRLTVTTEQNGNGEWILADNGGNVLQEGYAYPSKEEAMKAMEQLWPENSVWHGQRENNGGWSIVI